MATHHGSAAIDGGDWCCLDSLLLTDRESWDAGDVVTDSAGAGTGQDCRSSSVLAHLLSSQPWGVIMLWAVNDINVDLVSLSDTRGLGSWTLSESWVWPNWTLSRASAPRTLLYTVPAWQSPCHAPCHAGGGNSWAAWAGDLNVWRVSWTRSPDQPVLLTCTKHWLSSGINWKEFNL